MLAYPGLAPDAILNMNCVTHDLLQTIINTRNHIAEVERKKAQTQGGAAQGQSMLPQNVVFNEETK